LHLAARTLADLEKARDGIRQAHNVNVSVHVANLADSGDAGALAKACADVDILVNNAGAIPGGGIDAVDEGTWRKSWDLKVFGYVNLTRAFYAVMRARRKGVIVNVIGVAGQTPVASYISGSAANAALMMFTRALGGMSLEDGVRVVGVNPGPIATDRMVTLMRTRAASELGDAERWRDLMSRLPGGRPGEPDEVAALIAFLASDRAAYITGTVVTIDGGLNARGRLV
jgi:NAD(P)-dependent dehydrogenase (short-subunit alcohol dehydrogenase family)